MKTVDERVLNCLEEQIGESFTTNSAMPDDLDSLDHTMLAMRVEDEFDINIYDEEYIKLETVDDFINLIKRELFQ